MEELLQLLGKDPLFFATEDNGSPQVRAIGFRMFHDGRLYFATDRRKDICRQLEKNPSVALAAVVEMQNLRIRGTAVFDNDNVVAREKVFEVAPHLKNMWQGADNPDLVIFYIDGLTATLTPPMGGGRVLV